MFTVSIAVVGAADLDDPCGLALFPAYANFLNVYGEINLIDYMSNLCALWAYIDMGLLLWAWCHNHFLNYENKI